jgi:hypothetical protein
MENILYPGHFPVASQKSLTGSRQGPQPWPGTDRFGNLKINGTLEGNVIRFYVVRGNQIDGTWDINANVSNLKGTWNTDGGGGSSGTWNLTRIERLFGPFSAAPRECPGVRTR